MSLFEFLVGEKYDPDDDPLSQADELEGNNLGLHVRSCTRRYAEIRRVQAANTRKLNVALLLIFAQFAVMLARDLIDLKQLFGLLF
jgi:hypothetical protein